MIQEKLLNAETTAIQLFDAIEKNNLIVPGKTEETLNTEVYMLASWKFGIDKHWHKRIVRSGSNTLAVYNDNPPNRALQDDDILFIDYGPIVDGYEADVARTYVIGNSAIKRKLKNDAERAWYETREWYRKQTKLKASELFQYVVEKAREYGWEFGGEIAGHIVGEFPHEQPPDPQTYELDIHPENHNDMFLPDANGTKRNWILEIHFIDKKNKIGGYFEQML